MIIVDCTSICRAAVQRQTAVTAYFSSKQVLLFVFASHTVATLTVHLKAKQSSVFTCAEKRGCMHIIENLEHLRVKCQ